jgi:uncharacterized membrane protein YeaQ/YmgE (transglycosylase-associated protein family)
MTLPGLFWTLLIGAAAGYIAGYLRQGKGFGLAGNLIVGVIGALLGGFLFSLIGLGASNLIGSLVCAVVGSLVFLALLNYLNKNR